MDFFALKGDTEELLDTLGLGKSAVFEAVQLPYLHPGRAALVSLKMPGSKTVTPLGYLGEIHPQTAENYEIGEKVYAAVINLDILQQAASGIKSMYKPLPKHPSIQRDIALLVKADVTAGEIESAVRERTGSLLADVKLFDVYQGPQVAEGYKSIAYTLTFRAADRTLTENEVAKPVRIILDHLSKKLGAVLRDK
jgi:phenylalanyl-tRNA synthetase beta chain